MCWRSQKRDPSVFKDKSMAVYAMAKFADNLRRKGKSDLADDIENFEDNLREEMSVEAVANWKNPPAITRKSRKKS